MQMMKKVISVVLAVIMIASVFAFSSSAGAPAPSGTYKVTMSYELVDESGNEIHAVTPGSTVTLNVYANSSTDNDKLYGFMHSIYFDEDIYTFIPDSLTWLGVTNWVDKANSDAVLQNATVGDNVYTNSKALWTDAEKADEPKWVSFIQVTGVEDIDATDYLVKENANSPMYSLKLKVNENAEIGESANIGCPASVNYYNRKTYCYTRTIATGTIGAGEVEPVQKWTVTVGSEAPSIVKYSATQIRFQGVSTKEDVPAYLEKGEKALFDIRTVATIDEAAFQEKFGNDGEAVNNITDIGFIYAPLKGTEFNFEEAVKAAETLEGDKATDGTYTKKVVTYIQHKEGSPYTFTCLVKDIANTDANKADGLYVIGYVADADGVYYTFDAATTVDYGAVYENVMARFN